MKIVYMGTPDFAVRPLQLLLENDFEIVGVITAPDKPAGRGKKLRPSPVKVFAESKNLNILQPTNLKNPEFVENLRSLEADLFVVVAFRMLPAVVFEMPPKGTINLHASLLPQYRGAAPINWAVMNGETETGVTSFFIEQKIDVGEMIFQEKVVISETMTAGELHDELMELGAKTVLKTAKAIEKGDFPRKKQPQGEENLKKAPKIYKETCQINWNQPTETVYNHIRGLSPYPAAFTFLGEKRLKIFFGEKIIENHNLEAGTPQSDGETYLKFATNDGFINCTEVQMEGKRRMKVEELLRGIKLDFLN